MFRSALRWIDPFVVALVSTLLIGVFVPVPTPVASGVGSASTISIGALFLLFGARLPTRDVIAGLRNLRLQGAILITTFIVFPSLGFAAHAVVAPLIGQAAFGLLYVAALPSTLTSSAAYTSLARGNVPAAITAAALSNLLGLAVTPALVLLLTRQSSAVGMSGLETVLFELLLPFVVGQCVQPLIGAKVRSLPWLSTTVDRTAILLSVFSAASSATRAHAWSSLSADAILTVVVTNATLIASAYGVILLLARLFRLSRADRMTLIMCGSAKSIGTGLPMAAVLFPPTTVALVSIPMIIFHQLQLLASSVIAGRVAHSATSDAPDASMGEL